MTIRADSALGHVFNDRELVCSCGTSYWDHLRNPRHCPNGCEFRKIRESLGLTKEALAKAAGVSVRTVARLENRQHSPQHDVRRRLLRAVGIPFERHRELFDIDPNGKEEA